MPVPVLTSNPCISVRRVLSPLFVSAGMELSEGKELAYLIVSTSGLLLTHQVKLVLCTERVCPSWYPYDAGHACSPILWVGDGGSRGEGARPRSSN